MIARSGSTGNECSGIVGTPKTSRSGKCSSAAQRDARNTPCWTMTAILIAFAMPPHHAFRHAPVALRVPTPTDLTGDERRPCPSPYHASDLRVDTPRDLFPRQTLAPNGRNRAISTGTYQGLTRRLLPGTMPRAY